MADEREARFAAIRLADGALVPLEAESVKNITSGSNVTLDVAIPADVRVAAAANRTLTTQGVDGKEIRVPLRARDLAAASDGSPEGLPSAIGKATVAEAMAPGTPALEVSHVVTAAADPISTYTRTTRNLYVAVVTPAGATPGPAVDVGLFGTQIAGANKYWHEVTAGGVTLRLANTIGARYTSKYNCSDPHGMWSEAAAKLGFTSALPPNTSVVIVGPKILPSNCQWLGLASLGGNPNSSGNVYVATDGLSADGWSTLAHELGHNMSLKHADALLCPTAADSAYSTTTSAWTGTGCREEEYGDGQDVMNAGPEHFAPFLSAPQSLRTGIIPPTAATVISTVGTRSVTLLPLAGRAGVRTAQVVNPTTGVTYYVEYRTKAGRDLQNCYGVNTGVRVLRFNPKTGATVLLDPSPTGQPYDPDPTLPAGRTFTSYDGAVRITTISATSANAQVLITTGLPKAGTPVGSLDSATGVLGGTARVAGWAIDPDAQPAATSIHVYIDGPAGSGARSVNIGAAKLPRPDVAKAYPKAGPNHGFIATITGLTPGSHTLYVYAINAAGAGDHLLLLARAIIVPPAPVPSKVSLSMPARARVGTAITASTKVTDQYGRAMPGRTVTLQKMQSGTRTWKTVKYLKTTSTGAASYRFANGVSGYYRCVSRAATGAPSKISPSVKVTSTARVAERRPATTMTHGRYLKVSGLVSRVPSPVVYIQYRYAGGSWRTGPRATVRGTAVSGKIKLNLRKTAYTRLYVKAATSYRGSISGSYATKVR